MANSSDVLSKKLKDISDLVFNGEIWIEAEETFYQSNIIRSIRKVLNNNDYIGDDKKELEVHEKIKNICSVNMNKKRSGVSCFFTGKKVERPQALKLFVKNILESDKIETNEIIVLASFRFFIDKVDKSISIKKMSCREMLLVEDFFEDKKSYKIFGRFNCWQGANVNYFEVFGMALNSKIFKNCIEEIKKARPPKRPLCA